MSSYYGANGGRFGKGRRLEFEPDLMARISWGRQPVRHRRPTGRIIGAALVACTVLAGATLWYSFSSDERAYATLADSTLALLRGVESEQAETSQAGWDLSMIWGASPVMAESTPSDILADEDVELRRTIIEGIRSRLAAIDPTWKQATPVAFGGVKATVAPARDGIPGTTAITGNLYFRTTSKVFAIELSAEQAGHRYIPTDVWQCTAIAVENNQNFADIVEAHSRQCYEAFLAEPAPSVDGSQLVTFSTTEPVFVTF